jgi:hypothetical protein
MKKQWYLIFAIVPFLIFTIFSFTNNSYGQSIENEKNFLSKTETFIFVQTIVENSDGELLNKRELENLLESEVSEKDPIVSIAGQKYQVIKRKQTISHDRDNVIASTMLAYSQNDALKTVARFAHDGYPIIPGDKVQSVWTFLKPVE